MEIQINNIKELIDFVNRSDISINDALKATKKCFGIASIVFIDEAGESTYTKADIIEKINNDKQKRVWIM